MNYYEILELKRDASKKDIRKKYRELMIKWHPDRYQDEEKKKECREMVKLIISAYETLSNANKRREYDAYLEQKKKKRSNNDNNDSNDSNDEQHAPTWKETKVTDKDIKEALKLFTIIMKEMQRKTDLGNELVEAVSHNKHKASREQYEQIFNLIDRGAYLDCYSVSGHTCLYYFARRNQLDWMKFFLDSGANVNAKTSKNKLTVLHIAVINKNLEMCKLLVSSYNAQLYHQEGRFKQTPLHLSLKYNKNNECLEITKLLIKNRKTYDWVFNSYSDLDYQDSSGNTPLHIALKNKLFDISSHLLNKGAKTNIKNNKGETAITLMCKLKQEKQLPCDLFYRLEIALNIESNQSSCLFM